VNKTPSGSWRANWRDPAGRQKSKTFRTRRDAAAYLATVETSKASGTYVSPHAGRVLFGEHAEQWMATRRTELTTSARDRSVMRTHVLAQWGKWPLSRIDELTVQTWVTALVGYRSRHVAVKCLQLTSGVLASAVRNRLIPFNPCDEVRVPAGRDRDTDEDNIISRDDLRSRLLPAVPVRHRGIVAVGAGAGLRWGEAAGLCLDAVNLDDGYLRVIRTVVEVSGHTSFKPYPKSRAGRRMIPLPGWVVDILRAHREQFVTGQADLVFANQVGGALRRTLFRSRVWRPSLVRAGLLGNVVCEDDHFEAQWEDAHGAKHSERFDTHPQAVQQVARSQDGGLRFHDLRHSYATWLVDDGVPPNMVQRVMGHERVITTLQLYTRRTDNWDRILRALSEPGEQDGDGDEGDDSGSADFLLTPRP
jgi:integrase